MALTVDAETGYEQDFTSELIGWAIVVFMAGYIVVALVVLAAKWKHRSKVGARVGNAKNHSHVVYKGLNREEPRPTMFEVISMACSELCVGSK